jgi:predicted O-linked N-acetylglucosamine transferase (SPINDLY family)
LERAVATGEELFRQGVAAHQSGDLAAAEACYRQLIEVFPHHPLCLANLAAIVAGRGEVAEAERLHLAAVHASPDFIESHFKLGNIYRRSGRLQEAAASYREVLRRVPDTPAALVNLGLTLGEAGNWPASAECLARAAAVAPELPDVLDLFGDALARCGRPREAVEAFRQSVARFPDSARSHLNLGLHLVASGARDEAMAALRRALELKPDYPEAHNMLGLALDGVGRADEAQAAYREALRGRPDFAEALENLGLNLGEQGRVAEAADALRRALELRPDPVTGSVLLTDLVYSAGLSPGEVRDRHAAWAAQFADALAPAEPPARRKDGGRLRVGYVFGDFRSQAAAAFLEALLAHHDRDHFHVSAYSNAIRGGPERLRERADSWRALAHLPDDRFAATIRADEIDVLVDLSGHTAGNRLLAFARKPAPVQLSLFGYPATTGLKAIDFRVTDATTDPPGAEHLYVEKLLRLPDVSWVYAPPADAPPPNAPPSADGRAFTFGCLNHPGKLSEPCLDAWAAILKAVPGSRLVLLASQSASAADALRERFTSRGVASDRLEFVFRMPAADYLTAYQPIDLALDPFPYNGGATTCDALWMGVPVVTFAGPDARGRQGASILNAVGLPEFVADSPAQLVSLAATWAGQRDSLAELRGSLRELVASSPLAAAAEYVRHLESAYRGL